MAAPGSPRRRRFAAHLREGRGTSSNALLEDGVNELDEERKSIAQQWRSEVGSAMEERESFNQQWRSEVAPAMEERKSICPPSSHVGRPSYNKGSSPRRSGRFSGVGRPSSPLHRAMRVSQEELDDDSGIAFNVLDGSFREEAWQIPERECIVRPKRTESLTGHQHAVSRIDEESSPRKLFEAPASKAPAHSSSLPPLVDDAKAPQRRLSRDSVDSLCSTNQVPGDIRTAQCTDESLQSKPGYANEGSRSSGSSGSRVFKDMPAASRPKSAEENLTDRRTTPIREADALPDLKHGSTSCSSADGFMDLPLVGSEYMKPSAADVGSKHFPTESTDSRITFTSEDSSVSSARATLAPVRGNTRKNHVLFSSEMSRATCSTRSGSGSPLSSTLSPTLSIQAPPGKPSKRQRDRLTFSSRGSGSTDERVSAQTNDGRPTIDSFASFERSCFTGEVHKERDEEIRLPIKPPSAPPQGGPSRRFPQRRRFASA